MTAPFLMVDDFLSDPKEAAEKLRRADYADRVGPDGETYKRVALMPASLFQEEIEKEVGFSIRPDYSLARLNFSGELPNNAIHADGGYSEWAAIVYLSNPGHAPSGTAFWRHVKYDIDSMPTEQEIRRRGRSPKRVLQQLTADWNRPEAWTQTHFAEMKFNRAIFFRCKSFHSRYPFEAFGDCPENGRLIFVSFFNRAEA